MTTTPVSPSLIATLPGRYYTDPEVFRREQEALLESMWFCAVRSADLDRPGAFRTVQAGRESVLITRDRTGALRAFLNVCRHRGPGCAPRSPARSAAVCDARTTPGRTGSTAGWSPRPT